MATEIKLPSLGEGVASGDVLEILVNVGDEVNKNDGLIELETDKATVTVPSPSAGKITKILVQAGQTVAVGQAFCEMEVSGASAAVAPPAPASTPAPTPSPAPTTASAVKPNVAVASPTSSAMALPSAVPVTAAGDTTSVSGPSKAMVIPQPAATIPPPFVAAQAGIANVEVVTADDAIPAGPAIRRFAREVGVDLTQVVGTGEGGRITRDDVLAVVRQINQAARNGGSTSSAVASTSPSAAAKTATPSSSSGQDEYGPVRVEKMSKIRKTIANQMHKSWSTAPRVVNFDDADVTELEAFRQASKDDYSARGIKLTTMPFLIKAIATALRHHPAMNASIDSENEQIIYKEYVNIGIAVDTDRGLVVPVLKSADKMSIPDIAFALSDLSARVRNNDFAVSDLRGGTFTISNLGAIGGTYSTPIINVPEVAILLVGRTRKLPVVMDDDSIKPRLMMPLSLAYDHRLVDGATAARFLNDVIAYLEAPSRLLLAV